MIQSIFQTLDYLSRWRQENKRQFGNVKASLAHGRSNVDLNFEVYAAQVASVDDVLNSIPAEIISKRAVECKSYARALFHWEQYIRQQKESMGSRDSQRDLDPYFGRLQEIYSQIDEPDGIEGITAQLRVPDVEQQIFEHQKAGRWTAAQSWYGLRLNENPDNAEVQISLLKCLTETGQYGKIPCTA
jgi:serine/threonine-protein kinase ATR